MLKWILTKTSQRGLLPYVLYSKYKGFIKYPAQRSVHCIIITYTLQRGLLYTSIYT